MPGFLKGTVGALISPGGCGKSMFALQLCLEIAGGDPIGIGETIKGKVVYISGEDPVEVVHNRVHSLTKNLDDKKKKKICENFKFCIPEIGNKPNMLDKEWVKETAMIGEGSELIVLDTLRRFHQEEENLSSSMSQVITSLEDIAKISKTSVLFLHHTNKLSISIGSNDNQQASRGSSVLSDNARWQCFLSSMNKQEASDFNINENERKEYVRFGINKINYSGGIKDTWFKRDIDGKLCLINLNVTSSNFKKKQKDQTTIF
jgi:hypothetical protein